MLQTMEREDTLGIQNTEKRRRVQRGGSSRHRRALEAKVGICISFYMGSKLNNLSKEMT